jgi:hypothetical protein
MPIVQLLEGSLIAVAEALDEFLIKVVSVHPLTLRASSAGVVRLRDEMDIAIALRARTRPSKRDYRRAAKAATSDRLRNPNFCRMCCT